MPTSSTMNLSKAAIRERAVAFAKSWEGAKSESAEKQTFWNELFAVFGIDRRQVAAFEELAKRASTGNIGWIDVLYPGQMAIEHKSLGEDLNKALGQLFDYLPALHKAEFPWLLVVSDFKRFAWRNLDTGDSGEFVIEDLPHNLEVFWWMAGHGASPFAFEDEEEANLVATGLMAKLHDELLASGYDAHALREWLTRILFCLFADDTDVWDRAGFHTYLARFTHPDGHDLGPMLAQLFEVLDTPPTQRARTLDEDLVAFTYINGDLFANRLPMPSCNESIRNALLDACKFDWGIISPAIFGSMFQNVMQPIERRQLGAHYTTEQNILRTIRPLFLDDFEAELAAANTRPKLERFLDMLPTLRFMDPACGCGNFLVIAYREIRRLETEALRRLSRQQRRTGQRTMSLDLLCKVNVAQFFGIEIEEFPARIARTALYLADHIANREISAEFGELFLRFPIPASPHIEIANALRMDWNDLLPAKEANYVFGNPPFSGQYTKSSGQADDLELAWGMNYNGYLDYVTGWFMKSITYAKNQDLRIAFVATSSICQGEPVAALWRPLLAAGVHIDFAWRPFVWKSEARGTAGVHIVIVGMSLSDRRDAVLYEVDGQGLETRSTVRNISPYLHPGPNIIVVPRSSPLARGAATVSYGSKPVDGGFLLVSADELPVIASDPMAMKYLRQFVGAKELIHNLPRWCLWLKNADPQDLRASAEIRRRLARVATFRAASTKGPTRSLATTPYLFAEDRQPDVPYLCIPAHVSENRRYFPVAHLGPEIVSGNHNFVAQDPNGILFALLSSSMFITWLRAVGGRLRADLRFSNTLVWNTFPFPDLDKGAQVKLSDAAEAILTARAAFPDASLADLYDPLSMPPPVLQAHEELDRVVDSIFAPRRRFSSEADRLTLLFERYEALITEGQLIPPTRRQTRQR